MAAPFISGMGAIASPGVTTAKILASFRAGISRPGRLTLFESPLDLPVFEATGFVAAHPYEDGVRTCELATLAAREALEDSALDPCLLARSRVGDCLGPT
ncbi:MAG: hypothetical protein WCH98_17995, partial [Verrucomicrobiota bacterium]